MNAKVLPIKSPRKTFEPCLDSKGRTIPHFFIHVKTGTIYFRKKFKRLGIPSLFVSTGEKTIGRAKTAAEVIVTKHKNKHLGIDDSAVFGRKATRSFRSVGEEVLIRHTPKQRPKTRLKHKQIIGELIEAFGAYDINSVTAREFESWVSSERRKRRRQTFMDYAKHMNLVMSFAYNEKYATHLVRFKNPDREASEEGRVFTPVEIRSLWEVMNDETRDQFVLSYECMMRLREALHLSWDRVDLKTGKVTLRADDVKTGTKTGRGREFILSEHALERMRNRFAKRNPRSPYVFPSPKNERQPVNENRHAWDVAKREAKIKGRARWHDLRHSALSHALLVSRIPPVVVSRYAGVSIRTIERVYLHSEAEQTREAAAAVSIPGKGLTRG